MRRAHGARVRRSARAAPRSREARQRLAPQREVAASSATSPSWMGPAARRASPIASLSAKMSVPTDSKLVSGSFDFNGSPGNPLLESHGQISIAGFYYDPNHEPNGSTIKGASVAYRRVRLMRLPRSERRLVLGWAPCGSLTASIRPCATRSPSGTPRMQLGGWIPEYWFSVGERLLRPLRCTRQLTRQEHSQGQVKPRLRSRTRDPASCGQPVRADRGVGPRVQIVPTIVPTTRTKVRATKWTQCTSCTLRMAR